ncbi:MAG: FAD:protein FMN transferase [Ruminococcaceae bacterium]|nr:FAD:protein FMN transferase [Oscillospiraceae bacterium]
MKKILLILTILLALTACGCRHAARSSFYMDTVITWDITHVSADALIDASEAITANVETMLSLHLEASAVSGLNRGETVRHPELAELLRITKSVAEAAGGAYDVTVAPLVQLWNVAHPDTDWTPPTEDEIADLRSLVDYRQIHIESDARAMPEWSVTLDDGASIDLGGIGKGYALGKCAAMLTGKNARGTVSFGGNIAVVGQKDDGSDWRVGVKDPAAPDTLCAILEIPSGIVAVSGGYERFAEYNGVRYHHIIDPATGHPADSGVASAAIWVKTADARNGAVADALSTALFIMGEDGAAQLYAEHIFDFEYFLVLDDGSFVVSEGLCDRFAEQ